MMCDPNQPVWAVLAPVFESTLRALVAELWPRAAGDPQIEVEWQLASGDGGWSAVYTAEGDALGVGEDGLAAALAERLGREVYLLHFDQDAAEHIPHPVHRYAPGVPPEGSDASAYEVASRLGVALPGRPRPYVSRAVGGAVVEGVTAEEVRAALGQTIDPEIVRIHPVALGTFVHSRRGPGGFGSQLSALFPEQRVYDVMRHQDTGLFVCTVFSAGEEVEELVLQADGEEEVDELVPRVDTVLGASEPERVLAALGILELLAEASEGTGSSP